MTKYNTIMPPDYKSIVDAVEHDVKKIQAQEEGVIVKSDKLEDKKEGGDTARSAKFHPIVEDVNEAAFTGRSSALEIDMLVKKDKDEKDTDR